MNWISWEVGPFPVPLPSKVSQVTTADETFLWFILQHCITSSWEVVAWCLPVTLQPQNVVGNWYMPLIPLALGLRCHGECMEGWDLYHIPNSDFKSAYSPSNSEWYGNEGVHCCYKCIGGPDAKYPLKSHKTLGVVWNLYFQHACLILPSGLEATVP